MLWPVLVTALYWSSVIDFYHGVPAVLIANCIRGLYFPGFCSFISLFSWWNLWMKSCSYGISSRETLSGLTSFIISSIVPYSCLLCTFTYYSPQIRKITNLFKNTDIRIALKSSNSLQRLTNAENKSKRKNTNAGGFMH